MKSGWKKYLLNISIAIGAGILLYILEETIRAKNTGFEVKTLWDWMDLLIIPLFLAGGAFFLNRSEREIEQQAAENRAKLEREIATDRQQDAALQSYLDRMADLLLKENLRVSENEEVRNVARIRTLTLLPGLDANRKRMVLLFLYESGLIAEQAIIDLTGADLTGANLEKINLMNANLSGADLSQSNLTEAQLGNANLKKARLNGARLFTTYLNGANLREASLRGALLKFSTLIGANLSQAYIKESDLSQTQMYQANLMEADLIDVDLSKATLTKASLMRACMEKVNFTEATVSKEQLATIESLVNSILPDGTKHK